MNDLYNQLLNVHGTKIITVTTITRPDMWDKLYITYDDGLSTLEKNPYHSVKKISVINGIINFNYENSVNRQRNRENKESDFTAQPRKWGKRIKGSPLISHIKEGKQKYYLEMKVEKVLKIEYRKIHDFDKIIPNNEIEPWIKKKDDFNQNLEKKVILRDFDLENIISIKGL